MTTAIEFNEEKHEYRVNGQRFPSVTQVIDAIMPGWQAADWYLQRGRAIHYGCALADANDLNWSTVDAEIEPRIRAWQKFRRDWPCEVTAIEQRRSSTIYRFAGTLDRILTNDGKYIIADLKSTISPQVRIQLGAYSLLAGRADMAVAVQLNDDATYRTLWMNRREVKEAEQQFLAALTTFNFMTKYQLLKGQQ